MIDEMRVATFSDVRLSVPKGMILGAVFFLERHLGFVKIGSGLGFRIMQVPEGPRIRIEETEAEFPSTPASLVFKVGRSNDVAAVLLDLAGVGGVDQEAEVIIVNEWRRKVRIPRLFNFDIEFYDA